MKVSDVAKSVVWAATGAVFVAGGMLVGRFATLVEQQIPREEHPPTGPPDPKAVPDRELARRVDQLAASIAALAARVEAGATPAASERVEAVTQRVDNLERLVEQAISQTPAMPPIDHVLGAVEQMISARIGGLDERLTDQVHAIELLRSASAQTDALLQKLIQAVETLAAPQVATRNESTARRPAGAEGTEAAREWDSPIG